MTADKAENRDFDHGFKAIYDRDVEWEEGAADSLLTLPKGAW